MKSKLSLLTILFLVIIIACNQSNKSNDKEPEATEAQQEEAAELITVKGKITNLETSEGISMAVIVIKGTTSAAMSDQNGGFMLQVPAGAKKLAISAQGFESLEVDIKAEEELEVKLVPKSE